MRHIKWYLVILSNTCVFIMIVMIFKLHLESEYWKEIKEENKLTDENEDNYRKYADKMKKFTYI